MKPTQLIRTTAAAAVLAVATPGWGAQQQGHQMGTGQTQPELHMAVAECAQAQPLAMRTIDAANMRLEAARQNNSPPAMRAAVDDMQDALRQLRGQLAPCAALQAAAPAGPHAGHAMPSTPGAAPAAPSTPAMQPGSAASAPAASATKTAPTAPHAGHPTPAKPAAPYATKPGAAAAKPTPPAAKPAEPHAGHTMPTPSKPATPAGSKPAAREHPVDHSKMPMGERGAQAGDAKLPVTPAERVMDPACPNVDTKTAPKATYQRKVYYFCSPKDRDEFVKDPAAYLKKRPRG